MKNLLKFFAENLNGITRSKTLSLLTVLTVFSSCSNLDESINEERLISGNSITSSIWTQEYLDQMGWDIPSITTKKNESSLSGKACQAPCFDESARCTAGNLDDGYITRFYDPRYGSHFLFSRVHTDNYTPEIVLEQMWRSPLKDYPNATNVYFYAYQYAERYGTRLMTTDPCELGNWAEGTFSCYGMQRGCSSNHWQQWGICGYLCAIPTSYNGVDYNVPIYRKRNVQTSMYLYTENPNEADGTYVLESLLGYAARL
ncbi:MAG: hypothetical protein AAGF77_10755 [Bacteroidota bacterium]